MRPIDVVASSDHNRQFEALPICIHKHLCSSLARSVWVCGREQTCLHKVFAIFINFAVHLIGRDVDETSNASSFGAFQHDMSAIDVCSRESVRIAKTQVHVRLGCEVKDGVYIVLLKACGHIRGTHNVALKKGKVWLRI